MGSLGGEASRGRCRGDAAGPRGAQPRPSPPRPGRPDVPPSGESAINCFGLSAL